jgi:hypothetical protein
MQRRFTITLRRSCAGPDVAERKDWLLGAAAFAVAAAVGIAFQRRVHEDS